MGFGEGLAMLAMINEMREEGYQITELCAAFELSKSSYDAARKRPPSKRAKKNEVIVSNDQRDP